MSERELPPTDSLSPEMQRLIKSQISRRTALTGAGALGMTAFLAACGTKGTANTNTASTQKATADLSDADKKLVVQIGRSISMLMKKMNQSIQLLMLSLLKLGYKSLTPMMSAITMSSLERFGIN